MFECRRSLNFSRSLSGHEILNALRKFTKAFKSDVDVYQRLVKDFDGVKSFNLGLVRRNANDDLPSDILVILGDGITDLQLDREYNDLKIASADLAYSVQYEATNAITDWVIKTRDLLCEILKSPRG